MKNLIFPIVAAFLVVGCAHVTPQKTNPVQLSKAEYASLQQSVAQDFAVPSSVELRNVKAYDNIYSDGTVIRSVCGELKTTLPVGTTGFIGFSRNYRDGKWIIPTISQPCY